MAGVNDITIAGGIITFLLILAFLMPIVQTEFNSPVITNNDITPLTNPDTTSINPLTAWEFWLNILLLPFWTFDVPFWVQVILLVPLRIILILIIARNIWIGGGA